MKLKVSDKLLCKKSHILVDKIEEGKYYEISNIRVDIEGYKMKDGWDVNELKNLGKMSQ